ncbi:MAG: peptidase MA family metallohydrolase [Nitrospiraceae bacterium]
MSLLGNERGSIGNLLVLLSLLLVLFVGLQFWSKRGSPAPPSLVSTTIAEPSLPSLASERAQISILACQQPIQIPASTSAPVLNEIHDLIEHGRYSEAEAKLRALPLNSLSDPAVRMNVATLWNNLGVGQTKTGGPAAGLSAYKTAVGANPRNAHAYLNLVLAYWELKDPALTTDMLDEAMRLAPHDPMPHIILAERSIAQDDLSNAATHLGHAKDRVLESPKAQAYLNEYMAYVDKAKRAEQKFLARGSMHFTVKYDGDEDHAVWTRVLEILEEAYRDIGRQLGYFPSKPILVVLHTREHFHDATGGPAWSDGLYDPSLGRIKIPTQGALTDQAWLTRVLRHEFVHALLDVRMGGRRIIPQWLNEGLAMQLAGDPPPDIPALIRGDVTVVNLTYLEGPWGGLSPPQAMVAYLEGNSATRYLIDRYGMDRVRDVLDKMATGQPFAPAFQDRVFISYDDFQRRWVESLNQRLSRADP